MKLRFLLLTPVALAQSFTSVVTTDLNGHPIQSISESTKDSHTELSRSVNGRQIPLEKTEEKIISQDSSGKVVERVTKKYDANGQLAQTERVVITEKKLGDGGSNIRAVTYRSDVNGRMQEAERQTTETHQGNGSSRSETVIEQPTLNGSFQATEKRASVSETRGATGAHSEETVYQRSESGDFYQRQRQVTDSKIVDGKTVSEMASYEPTGTVGNLQLARQIVTTTVKKPDGSELAEVNVYGRAADGRVNEPGAALQMKEQQIINREKGPGDSVVETLSVRRPSVSEPTRLGGLQKISETVCTGKCGPDAKP